MAVPTPGSNNADDEPSRGIPVGRGWLLTDRSMLSRAIQRDQRALSALCRVYWRPVYCFVCAHRVDEELARDITQGIFLNLMRRDLHTLDIERGSRFRSWLKRVAHRQVLNALRCKKRVDRRERPEEEAPDVSFVAVDMVLQDRLFDRRAARALMDRAWERLRRQKSPDELVVFDHVRQHLRGEQTATTHLELSRRLGQCDSYVGTACNRIKDEEFPAAMRAELKAIGVTAGRMDEELRALRDAFH